MLPTIDPRDAQLAETLVRYSVKAGPGDLVFIQCNGLDTLGLGAACVQETVRAGAAPYLHIVEPQIHRLMMHTLPVEEKAASKKAAKGSKAAVSAEGVLKRMSRYELKQMQDATCFIGIRGPENAFEMSDVPSAAMSLYNKLVAKPVHLEERVKRTRWCVLRYPNPAMAQLAQKSTAAFAEFYYQVCLVDYSKMARAVQPLKKLMDQTDQVHITGDGTDVQFSIKGVGAVPCTGEMNIPDGECFTAPVRDSVEGVVQFNAPTLWEGRGYDNVRLVFKRGKVVEATAADTAQTEALNRVLNQDAGARYLGEFSLAFHPYILEPMRDILFDEKIAGSFHMALGQAYDEAPNGNKSAVHWDMVCIQRPEKGGGEIRFDGKLIRRDGEFLPRELKGLNRAAFGAS